MIIKSNEIKKTVKAVEPYTFGADKSFKCQPYEAWLQIGGKVAKSHYPPRFLHGVVYKADFPTFAESKSEARLRFVEPVALTFDTFPDYLLYEVIPVIWDCWPQHLDKTVKWLKRHNVRAAVFTSSQTAAKIHEKLPNLNILSITEGIDVSAYRQGDNLCSRTIDLLEYGSTKRNFFSRLVDGINHVNRSNAKGSMDSIARLRTTISNAKVTIALPRCDTDPVATGGIETLTQRFWECMLSRTVMLGRAPKELVDLIGYNPVVDLDRQRPDEQVRNIVSHISDFQELVDKNRLTALRLAPWEIRMKNVMDWLAGLGYSRN